MRYQCSKGALIIGFIRLSIKVFVAIVFVLCLFLSVFYRFFLFCLGFCVLLVCCFVFNFFYECIICWGRAVFRRSFLELMFVFGKRNDVAVLLLRFLFVFFNDCTICWRRVVFRRRFLELMFVFGKRNVVAVLLLRFLFVFLMNVLFVEDALYFVEGSWN